MRNVFTWIIGALAYHTVFSDWLIDKYMCDVKATGVDYTVMGPWKIKFVVTWLSKNLFWKIYNVSTVYTGTLKALKLDLNLEFPNSQSIPHTNSL